ncbi:probable WRKY transcription factor 53 [Rutidosis leptorrhynchoides]|uniref:probable WRKY transcription factor 53 n=1 Tax=Rutidosis leptorrhynchoides TaxID=125765 RepID=UPI003A99243B
MDTSVCIINELTQGMELARQLKSILSSESSLETKHALLQEIISSYDRALLMVNWVDSSAQIPTLAQPIPSQPESSVSMDESPRSGEFNKHFEIQQDQKVVSKKRKTMPTWKNQIRISTDNGLEGNTDDGYSWRKYGQKDILGAKYPRSYYRCTYRYVHNCMSRKQVQRTDEDPTVFEITYRGKHTCNPAAIAPPRSPEKHEIHHHNHQLLPPPKSEKVLSNLRTNLRVSTSDLDTTVPNSFSFPLASFGQQFQNSNETDNNFLQGYSPSGSNYFTEWGNDFVHQDESNWSEMIPTTNSATNSPLAFRTDHHDLNPNFPFNKSGFFI